MSANLVYAMMGHEHDRRKALPVITVVNVVFDG
jgi:hypothetical protein